MKFDSCRHAEPDGAREVVHPWSGRSMEAHLSRFGWKTGGILLLVFALVVSMARPVRCVAHPAGFSVLTREHADLRILYSPGESNQLQLVARDENRGIDNTGDAVILVVREQARLVLPPNTPFGEAGAPLWILPQSQNLHLLYLGVSAEGLPAGVFSEPLSVRLKRFDGPGYFMAWQATGPGQFNIRINTRDGLSAADAFTPALGSHEHFNWGFSTTGVFSLTFQVIGRRTGAVTNLSSSETTFVFHVQPLLAPTNFTAWQRGHWPPGFHPPTTEPGADPDGDGAVNLLEYAAGTSPTNALSTAPPPALAFVELEGRRHGAVTFERYLPALDLDYFAEAADTPAGNWQPLTDLFAASPAGEFTRRETYCDDASITQFPRRFYRLKAALR